MDVTVYGDKARTQGGSPCKAEGGGEGGLGHRSANGQEARFH